MSAILSEKMPEDVQMEERVESASTAREDAAVEPWYVSLRKSMSLPESINDDGSFNLRYFQPRRAEKKRWSNTKEGAKLAQGLCKHGVGAWEEIRREFLPGWETIQIRLRASMALGQQRLDGSDIAGWKPADAAAIAVRREETKRKALQTGTWSAKFGLVLDPEFGDLTARNGGVLDARSSPVKGARKETTEDEVEADEKMSEEAESKESDRGKGKGQSDKGM